MMQWIVARSLRFRHLVIFSAVALMVFGIGQMQAMPVDVFPEFAPPRVEIQTPCLGLSSSEVEQLVTVPLEEVFNGTPGLAVMRSKSVEQLSSIVLIFEPGTDIMEARQVVAERLAIATPTLPTWAAPPFMLPPLSSTARTMKIGISSKEHSVIDLSMTTYWKIRERLLGVRGVANVAIWGERIQMPQVRVDPKRLAAHGVTVNDVMRTTSDTLDAGMMQFSNGATIGKGGVLETPNQQLAIRHIQSIVTPDDLARVPIGDKKKSDGTPVRLGDVADVLVDTWPMIGDAVINDGPGLLLIVEKFPWANAVEVTNGVEAAIDEMRPGLPGVDIDTTIFRPATFIEVALENLMRSLLIGAGLVVLILLLFLWDWRTALISVVAIPLSLIAAGLVLYLRGTTINTMVLAGFVISVGVVVDDAIIDVENIVRRLRQARLEGSSQSTAKIILDASVEVRSAIVYATLIDVITLIGLAVVPLLGQSLLPSFKERDFLMHWVAKPGTSHPEMVRITTAACKELRTIPGVRNCGTHIGQALLMDEVYGIYFAENWISVDPSVDYDATLAKVQELVDGYPGLQRDVQTYLKERIREVLTGSSHPIVVRIYGEDLAVLREKAHEVEEKLSGINGLTDLHVELLTDIPQLQIEVDLAKAQRYGLKPGDVRRAAAYLVAGEEAGDLHTGNRTFDVNVWTQPESRDSLTDIQGLLIDTPSGEQVRLGDVADVRIVPTPNAINREGQARRINIDAEVKGRDLGSVVADVDQALKQIEFPHGYHPELIGEYAERQAAQRSLLITGLIAMLVIFTVLRVALGSWRLALMSFLSVPVAAVGGVLAAYFASDGILSLGSLVGFLTILGIVARNGIMMISHYQHLEQQEGEAFGPELIRRGARERLSPIMMTALATGLALVPLVIAGNIPGHEIEHPMAIVILGGLVTSTLINLFIVPALYLRFGRGRQVLVLGHAAVPAPGGVA